MSPYFADQKKESLTFLFRQADKNHERHIHAAQIQLHSKPSWRTQNLSERNYLHGDSKKTDSWLHYIVYLYTEAWRRHIYNDHNFNFKPIFMNDTEANSLTICHYTCLANIVKNMRKMNDINTSEISLFSHTTLKRTQNICYHISDYPSFKCRSCK